MAVPRCYILTMHFNQYDVVDDDLNVQNLEAFEILGVYSDEELALRHKAEWEADTAPELVTIEISDYILIGKD